MLLTVPMSLCGLGNGTDGTDHGQGSSTMLLDAFIGGAVAGHFATDPARTMAALFPASQSARERGFVCA